MYINNKLIKFALLALSSMMIATNNVVVVSGADLEKVTPESMNADPEKIAEIGILMDKLFAEGGFPGAAVQITRGGKIIFEHAAGNNDLERGTPFTTESICRQLPMSKPVTAVGIMRLMDKGLIKETDLVKNWIPEFGYAEVYAGKDEYGNILTKPLEEDITILHLLTHTSGLGYGGLFGGNEADQNYIPRMMLMELHNFVDRVAAYPLVSQPGTEWYYSTSFDILGRVIEIITGQDFDDYMRDEVFEPLDMKDSGFYVPASKISRFATTYELNDAGTGFSYIEKPRANMFAYSAPDLLSGGAGVLSTTRDYTRMLVMLINRGELDGKRFLSSEVTDKMFTNYLREDQMGFGVNGWSTGPWTGFGYGVTVSTPEHVQTMTTKEQQQLSEINWGGGASTNFFASRRGDWTIVFMTQYYTTHDELEQVIKPYVYDATFEKSPRQLSADAAGKDFFISEDAETKVGTYVEPEQPAGNVRGGGWW